MDFHTFVLYAHLVLFVYWLGPDWGVYVTTHYICKPELPIEERRRFLTAMLRSDLLPRSCLILMFPVGLTLADSLGLSTVTGTWLWITWIVFLAWLVLSWAVYLNKAPSSGSTFRSVDNRIRWVVAPVLVVAGTVSLVMDEVFCSNWLGLKVMLFGVLV